MAAACGHTVTALGRVAEIHDRILGRITKETSGLQFCNRIAGGHGFEIRLGFFVDGGEPGNLHVHLVVLGYRTGGGRGCMVAFIPVLCLRRVFITIFAVGACSYDVEEEVRIR